MPLRGGQPADSMSDTVMDVRALGHGALDFLTNDFMMPSCDITTIAGDGIAPEACQPAVAVLCESSGITMTESICRALVCDMGRRWVAKWRRIFDRHGKAGSYNPPTPRSSLARLASDCPR